MTSEAEVLNYTAPLARTNTDPTLKHRACEWRGKGHVVVNTRPRPVITEARDAIVRMTHTTICGSDLHIYHHELKGVAPGDVMGHEGIGIVEMVGPEVKKFKPGDRVVISAVIACMQCDFCKAQMYSLCDTTNSKSPLEQLWGTSLGGIFGYTHYLGGYDGLQAEYARVPLADNNLLKLPEKIPPEVGVLLSDVACTAWHANELAEVSQGKSVAVWGAGPIGLMALFWAKYRGAKTLISVEGDEHRLQLAQKLGAIAIDFHKEKDVVAAIKRHLPHGPDCVIEAAGFRFSKTRLDSMQRAVGLETDTSEIITELLKSVRKGGNVALIGDYFQTANNFPIGPLMEKGLTVRGSQVYVQRYWEKLLGIFQEGKADPRFIISHRLPFENMADAYKIFDQHADNAVKLLITIQPQQP